MRTKTLIVAGAVAVLGCVASYAQVYSQNTVGFYTLNLKSGFNLIANQLNNGDNNINTLIPPASTLPNNSELTKWNTAMQMFGDSDAYFSGLGWFDKDLNQSTTTLVPGEGAFLSVVTAADVVLLGDVPEGTLTKDLQAGLQIISQLTPQELSLNASGFPAGENDGLLFWDPVAQRYLDEINFFTGAWYDAALNEVQPTPKLGEAVFYKKFAAGTVPWTRTFDVSP